MKRPTLSISITEGTLLECRLELFLGQIRSPSSMVEIRRKELDQGKS